MSIILPNENNERVESLKSAIIRPTEVAWYPMRITYQRELSVKESLDKIGIESFLPMKTTIIETPDGAKRSAIPAIHNLLFVHESKNRITELKNSYGTLEPMRYMIRHALSDTTPNTIITVPDKQMDDFMRVATAPEDKMLFLENSDYLIKAGRRVRVVEGPFAGVEGVIKRIQNNRRVVVQIENFAAVAIAYVHASQMIYID